jgi:hypothetical protein
MVAGVIKWLRRRKSTGPSGTPGASQDAAQPAPNGQ